MPKLKDLVRLTIAMTILLLIVAGCADGQSAQPEIDSTETATETTSAAIEEPVEEASTEDSISDLIVFSLPERLGPRTQTSGIVPHVQIGVEAVTVVNDELYRRAFSLPGVEDRPTIVSLPGARGMWLSDDYALANPEAIVNGREFAHIHPDGSLHAPLPYERALEVAEKGWGERHPWADEREGWDGFVMIYTPLTQDHLDVVKQLLEGSYQYVTGQPATN